MSGRPSDPPGPTHHESLLAHRFGLDAPEHPCSPTNPRAARSPVRRPSVLPPSAWETTHSRRTIPIDVQTCGRQRAPTRHVCPGRVRVWFRLGSVRLRKRRLRLPHAGDTSRSNLPRTIWRLDAHVACALPLVSQPSTGKGRRRVDGDIGQFGDGRRPRQGTNGHHPCLRTGKIGVLEGRMTEEAGGEVDGAESAPGSAPDQCWRQDDTFRNLPPRMR